MIRRSGGQTPALEFLDRLFIGGGAVHAEEEVVLVLDQED
jgi:hypothetical protein